MGRIPIITAFTLVLVAGLPRARAQVPTTVAPRTSPAPAPAPAQQQQQPVVVPVPADSLPQTSAEEDTGFFYLPEEYEYADAPGFQPAPAPLFHNVRRGDTLWDICFLYFNNPWEWPRIWSYNPDITNPHWIYPGDRVRLYAKGSEPVAEEVIPSELPVDVEGGQEELPPVTEAEPRAQPRQQGVRLRRLAFVDQDTREGAFTIVGAVEEKSLLSEGDSVYLDYPANRPPEQGERYTVYTETSPVQHPDTEQVIGSYARILGELQVVSVREGKRARAFITDSVDVIERGAMVGPLQRTFRTVAPARNQVELQGTIVALVGGEQKLIGQNQVVFVDKGSENGLETGNRMFVVRRGDAYGSQRTPAPTVGQDDRRFPARAIGEILIVETGKRVSAALVTLALREFGVGDRVLMRKSSE